MYEFEPVGVSIHTPLTDAFVDLTYGTTSEIEHYQSDYPALYRVLYAVNFVFIQITRHYRGKVRDKEEWRLAVRSVFKQHRARINSPQELQSYMVVHFVTTLAVTTPGVTPLLIGAFYMGCVPAALSEGLFPERRWPLWALVLVLWATLWLALVGVGLGNSE